MSVAHGWRDTLRGGRDDADPGVVVLSTTSPGQTRTVGAELATLLHGGDVVLVAGELGAGKTTLVQGIASGLGVADEVTSPTFTLVRPYPCDPPPPPPGAAEPGDAAPVRLMLHADLYRLERLGEVADLGLGELVEDSAVAVVEWGDVAATVLGRDALAVTLEVGVAEDDRRIAIRAGPSWAPRRRAIEALADEWGRRGAGRTR